MTSFVILKNHFNNNSTVIYQLNGVKFISNGCQDFKEEKADVVYRTQKVDSDSIQDVAEALAKINRDVTMGEFKEVLYEGGNPFMALMDRKTGVVDKEGLLTESEVEVALQLDKHYFIQIPERFKTKDLTIEILKSKPSFLRYANKEHISKELYLEIIYSFPYLIDVEGYEDFQNEDLLKYVVGEGGINIKYISKNLITQELVDIAFQENKGILGIIDKKYITEEMVWESALALPSNLFSVPNEFISEEHKKYIFKYFPNVGVEGSPYKPETITQQMLEEVIDLNFDKICDIPRVLLNMELYNYAVSKLPEDDSQQYRVAILRDIKLSLIYAGNWGLKSITLEELSGKVEYLKIKGNGKKIFIKDNDEEGANGDPVFTLEYEDGSEFRTLSKSLGVIIVNQNEVEISRMSFLSPSEVI